MTTAQIWARYLIIYRYDHGAVHFLNQFFPVYMYNGQNTIELMRHHCGTNNSTRVDIYWPLDAGGETRYPDVSASPAQQAASTIETHRTHLYKGLALGLDRQTLCRRCQDNKTPLRGYN